MKAIKKQIALLFFVLLLSNIPVFAQANVSPKYITVTTMHWNMDKDDFKMEDWKAVEKEYKEKITNKNEHIIGSSYYTHYYTPDNTEVLFVQTFPSWEAIEASGKRTEELLKATWPDEKSRTAFMKNYSSYFVMNHSDEIYATLPYSKIIPTTPDKDLILYVRKKHFVDYEKGTEKEFMELSEVWTDNVINKNDLIKGYYPYMHAWGSDKTEYIEAFFFDDLGALETFGDRDIELAKEAWTEKELDEMGEKYGKYFDGTHGDFIYKYVSGI